MRSLSILALGGLLALSGSLTAQAGQFVLDDCGNYVAGGVRSSAGVDLPGDLHRTVSTNIGNISGLGPLANGNIMAGSYNDGLLEVWEIDYNGFLIATTPVLEDGDAWLGVDQIRNLVITCNASSDRIRGYEIGTGTVAFDVPAFTPGAVGLAHDPIRDIYWYADWVENEVIGLSAQGLVEVDRFEPTGPSGSLTRLSGVAYDCLSDAIIVGGRDQQLLGMYEADVLHTELGTWISPGVSVNDPQAAGLSTWSMVLTTDFFDGDIREQESTHEPYPSLEGTRTANDVTLTIGNCGLETRAVFGWSSFSGSAVVKGVQTCLGLPAKKLGSAAFNVGTKGTLNTTVPASALYFQAACLPSLTVTNLIALP